MGWNESMSQAISHLVSCMSGDVCMPSVLHSQEVHKIINAHPKKDGRLTVEHSALESTGVLTDGLETHVFQVSAKSVTPMFWGPAQSAQSFAELPTSAGLGPRTSLWRFDNCDLVSWCLWLAEGTLAISLLEAPNPFHSHGDKQSTRGRVNHRGMMVHLVPHMFF